MNRAKEVAVFQGVPSYPSQPPFHPSEAYPEYGLGVIAPNQPNAAYEAVRGALQLLGLDAEHSNTPQWNPLRGIVRPGDRVVLKPNWVRDFRETHPGHDDCLITHGAIIRAAVDYVYLALGGRGRIIIADAPQNDADFERICEITQVREIQRFYQEHAGFEIECYDLRPERAEKVDGVIVDHVALPGDPRGYVCVNLGLKSAFSEINHLCHLLYGSEYDMRELRRHQHGDVHEYLISKTVLEADCVISLPKLKTHKKTGITVNMKNMVGINGNKNWLPHHREGIPADGGDQFPHNGLYNKAERLMVAGFKHLFPLLGAFRRVLAAPIKAVGKRVFGDTNVNRIRSGNWYGNDTTWRMCIDLNRVLMYGRADGTLAEQPARRFFSVVDGIVAGEGNGPLDPVAKPTGVVLAGSNPIAVDIVAARLMGFDYHRLPVLHRAMEDHPLPLVLFGLDEIVARSNEEAFNQPVTCFNGADFAFEAHFGWKGHVELRPEEREHVAGHPRG